jgi:hypothetical protein
MNVEKGKNIYLPIDAVKAVIDEYFTIYQPALNEDGSAKISHEKGRGRKKVPNQHYARTVVNTKDANQLSGFADMKLKEYLNPGPSDVNIKTESVYVNQIIKDNAINKERRTPKMFYEVEIVRAEKYQKYFPKFRENSEHLHYWSILNDWVVFLSERLQLQGESHKNGKHTFEAVDKIDLLSFVDLLSERGKKAWPFIEDSFKNLKPKQCAILMMALKDLKIIDSSVLANKTRLHEQLSEAFGKIGSRQQLTTNIERLSHSPTSSDELLIKSFREKIQEHLQSP